MSVGPLAGVRVLDLAGEAGVFAGRMLAELGGDVVRVEPVAGDAVRRRPPFLVGSETEAGAVSLYHLHFNAGKRGVSVDLGSAAGRGVLRALVERSDVVVTTASAEALAELGVGFEAVEGARRGIVWASILPFASEGAMAGYRANDLVACAMSGMLYLNGLPEDPPLVPGAEQAYQMASIAAVAAAMVALAARERDPERRGRVVEVSLQEAMCMSTLQTANANIFGWHGRVPKRVGLVGSGLRNLFPCADGKWISFTIPVGTGPLWGHFVEWLDERGVAHEFQGAEWFEPSFRAPHVEAIADAIGRLVATMPRDEVFHDGQRRRMLTMPVNDVADLLVDEQLQSRGFFRELEHPSLGRSFTVPGSAYHFSATPTELPRCAPGVGEHNREVLREWLGMGEDEVAALEREGVL